MLPAMPAFAAHATPRRLPIDSYKHADDKSSRFAAAAMIRHDFLPPSLMSYVRLLMSLAYVAAIRRCGNSILA